MNARIVVVHRYFWPDTPPYASILRAIADRWADDGDVVRVLTAQPSYNRTRARRPSRERLDRLDIERVAVLDEHRHPIGRLVNLVLFPILIAAKILTGPKPNVVMCSTAPQVTLGFLVSWAARRRGAEFVYHCMDLQPEIGRLSGDFANPLAYRILMAMDTATMRRAARVVVLSADMRREMAGRDRDLDRKVIVLNNFALPDYGAGEDEFDRAAYTRRPNAMLIVFTGNIGRFQRLDEVVEALGRARVDIDLVFMGEGKAVDAVRRAADRVSGDRLQVTFLPQGSSRQARGLMDEADLGLVSLAPQVVRYAYPSKTATYLCEGLPVLIYCESDSELARTVGERGIGWTADSPEKLVAAVESAYSTFSDHDASKALRDQVHKLAAEEFAAEVALERWMQLRHDVFDGSRSHV